MDGRKTRMVLQRLPQNDLEGEEMKIKQTVLDCGYAIYPFGKGAPCCLEDVEKTGDTKKLKECVMKKCPKYKIKEEKK